MGESALVDFIQQTQYSELPAATREDLHKALFDGLVAMCAGVVTPTAAIMADYAAAILPGAEATVVGRGAICNAAGAALANACAANALDIDDGFRLAKGHPGAVVIPALLAQAEAVHASGEDFLTALAIGYEVAMRASVAWHSDPQRGPSYHGSGSWGSVGAAAACARLLKLTPDQTRMALGIAEYHAPIAPIMTCVEHPTMVKDGIHWGAFTGVTAAQLAARGFTGIPSLLAQPAHANLVATLGQDWWLQRLYYKFFPCCRWAQPAVAAALDLRQRYSLTPEMIKIVQVETFAAATHLRTRHPDTTEEAQYSLPYPVACALARGQVGVAEVTGESLHDAAIAALAACVEMVVAPDLEARFPAEALARVRVFTTGGDELCAGPVAAPGDADDDVALDRLLRKAHQLLDSQLGAAFVEALAQTIRDCVNLPSVDSLVGQLALAHPARQEMSVTRVRRNHVSFKI